MLFPLAGLQVLPITEKLTQPESPIRAAPQHRVAHEERTPQHRHHRDRGLLQQLQGRHRPRELVALRRPASKRAHCARSICWTSSAFRATFFGVGWIANRIPEVFREVARQRA
jgi:hypothetical protein